MARSSKAGEHHTRAERERDDRRADVAHVLTLNAIKNAPKPTKGTLLDFARASNEQAEHFSESESLIEEALEEYNASLDRLQRVVQAQLGIGGGRRTPNYLAKRLAEKARTPREVEAALVLFTRYSRHGPLLDEFMREHYVPSFNRVSGKWLRCCEECFRAFKPTGSRDRFCNETCAGRARNRGRQKVDGGKSGAEAALARRQKAADRHKKHCPACRRGEHCLKSQELWDRIMDADAMTKRAPDADVEMVADGDAVQIGEAEAAEESAELPEREPVRRLRNRAK